MDNFLAIQTNLGRGKVVSRWPHGTAETHTHALARARMHTHSDLWEERRECK